MVRSSSFDQLHMHVSDISGKVERDLCSNYAWLPYRVESLQ